MPTIPRSLRPACPACGFPVFNRRYPKCEKCLCALPDSIAYTTQEIAALREKESREEQQREHRRARDRGKPLRYGLGFVETDGRTSAIADIVDLGADLLDSGS